jgi:hypothetical protein
MRSPAFFPGPRRRLRPETVPRGIVSADAKIVKERRDVRDLSGREIELWHSLGQTAVQEHRTEQLAVAIVQQNAATDQVWPDISAASVVAMAESQLTP